MQDWLGKKKRGRSGAVRERLCAELSREAESGTVKLMGWRYVGGVCRGGAETEQHSGRGERPLGGGGIVPRGH